MFVFCIAFFTFTFFLTILKQFYSKKTLSDLGIVDNFSFLSPSSWVMLVSSSLGATPLELPEADDFAVFGAVDDKKFISQ